MVLEICVDECESELDFALIQAGVDEMKCRRTMILYASAATCCSILMTARRAFLELEWGDDGSVAVLLSRCREGYEIGKRNAGYGCFRGSCLFARSQADQNHVRRKANEQSVTCGETRAGDDRGGADDSKTMTETDGAERARVKGHKSLI